MAIFLISVIFIIIGVACPIAISRMKKTDPKLKVSPIVAVIPLLIGAVLMTFTFVYSQDAGEVIVLKSISGTLVGYTEDPGFHVKTPWTSTISYDVRNNLVNLYRDAEYSYNGGAAEGSCVTVNDKGGASADIDLQVVYSLDGDSALQLYMDYGTQQKFTSDVILNDVRATAREVAGKYDTLTMLTNRGQFTKGVHEALAAKWSSMGLNVEQVSVQDVRYPASITDKYAEAQAAEVAKQKAQNEQETAKVEAETKRIKAEGEANANRVLSESLTEEVLQQHYIDALTQIGKDGNLVVVPEGSQPIVQTNK